MIIVDLLAALQRYDRQPKVILAAPRMPLANLKSSVKTQMTRAYKGYLEDEDIGDLTTQMQDVLGPAYQDAYLLGKKTTEVSDKEQKWIKKQKRQQFQYLDGFMADLDADASVMDPMERMDAYLSKLDGMFWSGHVAGSPKGTEINWITVPGNNCDDCLDFEDGSPYDRDDLDAVPGDGSTSCLYNCNCYLENVKDE